MLIEIIFHSPFDHFRILCWEKEICIWIEITFFSFGCSEKPLLIKRRELLIQLIGYLLHRRTLGYIYLYWRKIEFPALKTQRYREEIFRRRKEICALFNLRIASEGANDQL